MRYSCWPFSLDSEMLEHAKGSGRELRKFGAAVRKNSHSDDKPDLILCGELVQQAILRSRNPPKRVGREPVNALESSPFRVERMSTTLA